MFIDLFQEIEVENLFKALDLCMEYARLDLHVFNIGAHVTCSYSNDLESLSQAEGCNVNMIIEVPRYRPIKETQDLPIDAKYIPLLTRIFGKNILAEIGGGKIFITTGKYAVNFWCWKK